jgi:hypothetical protein
VKQLLENKVRVKFVDGSGNVVSARWFDLCIDDERREMGKLCGKWQSTTVGNKVESEVMTIVRAR